jgi:hypothetical protein
MRRDGATKAEAGSGPWLNLFIGAVAAVIAAIAALSWSPVRPLETLQPDLHAPQVLAPAAPSAMR